VSFLNRVFGRWKNPNYARGMMHYNRREYAQAVEAFDALLQEVRDPSNPEVELARFYAAEAHAKLGLALLRHGEFERAGQEFAGAIAVEPTFPDLHYHLGVLCARDGKPAEARAYFDRALELHPAYAEALAYRAVVREAAGDAAGAAEDVARLVELKFPLPRSLVQTAGANLPAHALEELRQAVEARAEGNRILAQAIESYDHGDLEAAEQELSEAVTRNPRYADLRCRLGQVRAEAGRHEDALKSYDAALEINPEYVEALVSRALSQLALDRAAEAVPGLQRALECEPSYADVAYLLGAALLRAGRPHEAEEPLRRALALNPEYWKARFALGQAHLALGEKSEGLADLETALGGNHKGEPESAFLGTVLLERGDYARAAENLALAVQRFPDYPDLRLRLGMAEMGRGNADAARVEFEAAARNPTTSKYEPHSKI